MKKHTHTHAAPENEAHQAPETRQPETQSEVQPEEAQPGSRGETQELIEHLQRLQAEFDNYRKRVERDQEEMKKAASERLLRDLLPIIDNLQLSVQHAKNDDGVIKGEDLLAGVIMINEQLQALLDHYGITVIPDGGKFDPRMHEALTTVAQEGAERGAVLQTYQRGYMRSGKVFRPARVSVAK